MTAVYLIVDKLEDWAPYHPSEQVITLPQYLELPISNRNRVRVINLSGDYGYLKPGYYCSLLAEAREHKVIPGSRVLNDLSQPSLYQLGLGDLGRVLAKLKPGSSGESLTFKTWFGFAEAENLKSLGRALFNQFPAPILEVTIAYDNRWLVSSVKLVAITELTEGEQTQFAEALESFSSRVWQSEKKRKEARFDLAILANPEEALPPSDKQALKKFIRAAADLNIDAEIITPADFIRIGEFDALFIRETTGIDHHTYRFAKKAEAEGLVVIDDPTSILRCTNKVYLARLFATHGVPAPKSMILTSVHRDDPATVAEHLGLPLVVKIPDGAFSKEIYKVSTLEELAERMDELLQKSSLLIAQEFLYTDFDWRIGVLNNKAIFACRYFMVKNHWQIYQHGDKTRSGGFATLPTFEVPKHVIQAALKATKPIGDGLYGVDVNQSGDKAFVIEVNDNPNVDSGVEDLYLGNELYEIIMGEFARRLEARQKA